jgi:amidohydrolase
MLNTWALPEVSSLESISKSLGEYAIALRRAFHKIPELSWKEEKTVALILSELREILIESLYPAKITEAKGGIWVDLFVGPELPWILFRSDVDALPIQEETGLPYQSEHKGCMHACGHDCHIAMLLSAFKAIAHGMVQPKSNIRFVWQRAEECGGALSGGSYLVKEGVCKNIDFVYGLHIASSLELNTFSSRENLMMANSSYVEFQIHCSGGHVMNPHLGSNAISILIDVLNHLNGFERAFFGPSEPIAFVPSIARSGDKSNIRPNSAYLCFAIRNFLSKERRSEFVSAIKQKVEKIIQLYQTASLSDFIFIPGYPSLYNHPASYEFVRNLLEDQLFVVEESSLQFSAEDFAYYLQETPGSFWCLGAKEGVSHDHHTPKFNPSEKALSKGIAFWLTLATKSH